MNSQNPEAKFITNNLAAYQGMTVEETVFCRMENHRGEEEDYKLDVIKASGADVSPRPVVIFVHGGGFVRPNDKRQGYIPVFARALTAAGYTVVSPDYPVFDSLTERAKWNETDGADLAAEAVYRAYRFIKEHAEQFGFDAARIAVMGGSAGGMTCFYLLEHYDVDVRMFGNCWGAPRIPVGDLTKFPPTLSIHGDADPTVPYTLELPIQDALAAAGVPHRLITLAGAGHTPMKRFSEYIPTVLEWLDRYLK